LDLFTNLKEKRLILGTQAIMANLYKAREDPDMARKFYEKAINGYIENNMLLDLPVFLFEYADMEESRGNKKKAKDLYKRSLDYAKRMDNRKWIDKSTERLETLS
jgi:tetratricopeptide (TPR) repeat protein